MGRVTQRQRKAIILIACAAGVMSLVSAGFAWCSGQPGHYLRTVVAACIVATMVMVLRQK